MVSPVFNTFRDAAPIRFAVIVLAEKLPELSRATIVPLVAALVASVASIISLVSLVIMVCVSPAPIVLKLSVLPVLSLNSCPV